MTKKIRYLSLFTGIGGFERGIETSKHKNNMRCIGYSEVDKYATSIYERHYPNHTRLGDATRIQTEDLPDFDLLVGGFPCQAFSHAGKRRGFNDTRGTLFFEIARILRDKKPRYFLLENVRGLLSHDKGNTFTTMLQILAELGYDVQWQIYNSKNHGVAQNRERLYIKGFSRERERCPREVLPLGGASTTVDARQRKTTEHTLIRVDDNPENNKYQAKRVYSTDGLSSTKFEKHQDNYVLIRDNTWKGYLECHRGDGITLGHYTGRGKVQRQSTATLDTSCSIGTLTDTYRIRRLTPLECEKLQGFPQGWTEYGSDGEKISDTQRYKCLGNAVTVNVVRDIMDDWNITDEEEE